MLPFTDGPQIVKPSCSNSAAFLNENIIREAITERYLEPTVNHSGGGVGKTKDIHDSTTERGDVARMLRKVVRVV